MTPPFAPSFRQKLVRFFKNRWTLLVVVFTLGWFGSSVTRRELFIGVGPEGTSLHPIALEAATEISNKVRGPRFVFCGNEGTDDALERLGKRRIPLLDPLLNQDCARLDVAAITDGTQSGMNAEGVVLISPFYKSYLQFLARKDKGIGDISSLILRAPELRLGISSRNLATHSRACLALNGARRSNERSCEGDAFRRLGFATVTEDDNLSRLVKGLVENRLDVVIAGGPICPRGTSELVKSADIAPIPWTDNSSPAEEQRYPCLGDVTARSQYSWTWLAGARGLHLSKAEVHHLLAGLNHLPERFRETNFANFDSLQSWPGFPGKGTTALTYSPIMSDYLRLRQSNPAGVNSNTFTDFLTLHLTAIQFISVLLAIAVAVTQLVSWRAKHHTP